MTARYQLAHKGRRRLAKPYHFTASALPNVYLRNGVRIERDPDYGELVTIDRLPDLIMGKRLQPRPQKLPPPCKDACGPATQALSRASHLRLA